MATIQLFCNICGSNATRKLGVTEGYRADTAFDVICCDTCGCNFVHPCESNNRVYEAIYRNIGAVPGYARYLQYARQVLKEKDPLDYLTGSDDCYWGIAQAVVSEVDRQQKKDLIWEVGCGQGYLTYALVRAGFNAIGLDVSQTAISLAKQRYGTYYFCEDAKTQFNRTKERPSIIILSEVIEHLTDPYSFLAELIGYLRPGGALIITTPNKNSCRTGAIWDTELPPVHLWWFTAKGLEALGERLSCRTLFTNFDEFYKQNLRFTAASGGGPQQRSPVLDNEYHVITSDGQGRTTIFPVLRLGIKRLIPKSILKIVQLRMAKRKGLSLVSALNPTSLCVTYRP